ncbi:DUF5325 family protein [Salirhabdus salicampi]|uniref:DUF5325 family protein n=1 Tax=Salirhabdus salicampi TaxID=476102 RepID=UPI0020C5AC54|nr:DUF5325 family protein [Salirhabdus salicampi]MCP8616075.1 DUF5325 family protein [Salirhabdus salicampi]
MGKFNLKMFLLAVSVISSFSLVGVAISYHNVLLTIFFFLLGFGLMGFGLKLKGKKQTTISS